MALEMYDVSFNDNALIDIDDQLARRAVSLTNNSVIDADVLGTASTGLISTVQ